MATFQETSFTALTNFTSTKRLLRWTCLKMFVTLAKANFWVSQEARFEAIITASTTRTNAKRGGGY